jgi:hypothetical protein
VSDAVVWLTLAGLGAFHGLNPAMGWLFATSRGFQERSRSEVVRSLGPIAAGHALSVAMVVALFGVARVAVSPDWLRYTCALILVAFGLFKLVKPLSHPRWVGMRVGYGQLSLWSFLMASAHGAGLMLVPALGRLPAGSDLASDAHVVIGASLLDSAPLASLAVGLHTVTMLAVMGVIAVVVYDRIGLAFLRKSWFNVDLLWAGSLMLAGAYVALLGL